MAESQNNYCAFATLIQTRVVICTAVCAGAETVTQSHMRKVTNIHVIQQVHLFTMYDEQSFAVYTIPRGFIYTQTQPIHMH